MDCIMSIFIKSPTEPTSPDATLRWVEKDLAIVRGVTLAMHDWSNPATYSGSGNVVNGTSFAGLTNGGAAATVAAGSSTSFFFPAVLNGTLRSLGGTFGTGSGFVNLPVDYCQPVGVTRSLQIVWARLPKTGWAVNGTFGLWNVGASVTTPATNQHGSFWATNAGGDISYLRYRVASQAAASFDLDANSADFINALGDGNLHQIGFVFETLGGGLARTSIWLDGVKMAERAAFAATSLNNPATKTGVFFSAPGAGTATGGNAALDLRFGRPSAHDLSARPDLSFAQMLEEDMAAAAGFVS